MSTLPESPSLEETKVAEPITAATPEQEETPEIQTVEVPAQTVDTAMLQEIMNEEPSFWRRPGFLAAAAATLAIGLGLYGMNRELPAQTVELEATDEATFDDEAKPVEEVAETKAEPSKPEMIVPPSSSMYSDPMISKLAFANSESNEEETKAEEVTPAIKTPAQAEAKAPSVMAKGGDSQPAGHLEQAAVRFAFNSAKLDKQTKLALDSAAKRMKKNKHLKLKLEGHADERGTVQYNYKLGLARANAARTYLVNKGVAKSRIHIVSFGKSRPSAKGQNESAWAVNRRVEIKDSAKAKAKLISSR